MNPSRYVAWMDRMLVEFNACWQNYLLKIYKYGTKNIITATLITLKKTHRYNRIKKC